MPRTTTILIHNVLKTEKCYKYGNIHNLCMSLSSIFLSLPKERKFYSLIYVHLKELHTHCVYTTKWNLAGITCFGIRVNLWSYTHCLILSGRGLQTNFPFPLFGSSNQHENIRLESGSRKLLLELKYGCLLSLIMILQYSWCILFSISSVYVSHKM